MKPGPPFLLEKKLLQTFGKILTFVFFMVLFCDQMLPEYGEKSATSPTLNTFFNPLIVINIVIVSISIISNVQCPGLTAR